MANAALHQHKESFADLLDETLGTENSLEGMVLRGTVVTIRNDLVQIDVGLKSEGYVPLKEFGAHPPKLGDEVDVFIDRYEDRNGDIALSRDKARREESWVDLEKAHVANTPVMGTMFSRVKGGFMVDLSGATGFLPNSQVDVRPIRDITPLMNMEQPFQILKMDKRRGNIVVSRRAILEESRAEARTEFVSTLTEGSTLQGVVKNITDYGAFIDLGGMDGLLHMTDISWRRISHPSEVLTIGQTLNVKIIRFNPENQRVSLGLKQLEVDPWENIADRFKIGEKYRGVVTNIADYGAFVELATGIEGLVHVSEMSWIKKNVEPGKIVSTSQDVDVVILEIDMDKRRISMGIKQCLPNPWEAFSEHHPVHSHIDGEIKNISDVGVIVSLQEGIEGIVLPENLSWKEPVSTVLESLKKGQMLTTVVLGIDADKEKVLLGLKQLSEDPSAKASAGIKKGGIVTVSVTKITEGGVEVDLGDSGFTGFIKRADLSRDRSEQRPDRFAVGEKLDAMITTVDKSGKKVGLSIKAMELDEERKAMAEYGSADSGASLGDILGPVIEQANKN
jgi:small subunit ribosomal protein S1